MAPGTCSLLVLVLRGPPTVIFAASSTANSRSAYQGLSAPPSFRTPQDRFSQSARLPPRANPAALRDFGSRAPNFHLMIEAADRAFQRTGPATHATRSISEVLASSNRRHVVDPRLNACHRALLLIPVPVKPRSRRAPHQTSHRFRRVPGPIGVDAPVHAADKEIATVCLLVSLRPHKPNGRQVCLHACSDGAIADLFSARITRRRRQRRSGDYARRLLRSTDQRPEHDSCCGTFADPDHRSLPREFRLLGDVRSRPWTALPLRVNGPATRYIIAASNRIGSV